MKPASKKRPHIEAILYDKRGRVLSRGTNSYVKTHPIQARWARAANQPNKLYLHAEIAALLRSGTYNKPRVPYKISVHRYNKEGRPMNAKPCPICEMAIKAAGIKVVEYTV